MATSNRKQASSLSAEFQVLIIYAVIFGISHFCHSGYFLCSFVLSRDLLPVNVLFPQYNHKLLDGRDHSYPSLCFCQ